MAIDGTDKISDTADYIVQYNASTPETSMSKIATVQHYKLHILIAGLQIGRAHV